MVKIGKYLLPALGGMAILCLLGAYALHSRQADPPAAQETEPPTQSNPHRQPDPTEQPPTMSLPGRSAPDTEGGAGMGNMFGPPPGPAAVPTAPPFRPPPAQQETPPAREDPFQNVLYAGYATLDEHGYALLEDSRTHEGTWLREGDTFQGYTVEHIGRQSLRLRQGETRRDLAMSDRFNAVPLIKDAPKEILADPGNLTAFRSKVGMSFYFQVTGRLNGSVWGSDTYTDDSSLGTAAVHAGLLRDGQPGVVRVTILPGYGSYDGSTRNGVTSNSYANWEGSYRVSR